MSAGAEAGRVARVSIAPVKGLALVHPDAVELTAAGATGDRRFHVADPDDRVVNGKRAGELVQVRPSLDLAGRRLALAFPDGEVVAGDVVLGAETITSFWGRAVPGHVVDGPFSEALSCFAGRPLRLVRSTDPGMASDRGPTISLVTTASFRRLADQASLDDPVDGRRFRMLIEVAGLEAHAEDAWVGRRLRLGDAAEAQAQGHVGRCVVTTRDPDRGVRDLDTLGAIAAYRRDLATTEKVSFGVWGVVLAPGRLSVGDAVAPVS